MTENIKTDQESTAETNKQKKGKLRREKGIKHIQSNAKRERESEKHMDFFLKGEHKDDKKANKHKKDFTRIMKMNKHDVCICIIG